MKTSFWGWLILIAGSWIYFISCLVHLAGHLVTPQFSWWTWMHGFLWIDTQAIRLAVDAVQSLWKAATLFLSVAASL